MRFHGMCVCYTCCKFVGCHLPLNKHNTSRGSYWLIGKNMCLAIVVSWVCPRRHLTFSTRLVPGFQPPLVRSKTMSQGFPPSFGCSIRAGPPLALSGERLAQQQPIPIEWCIDRGNLHGVQRIIESCAWMVWGLGYKYKCLV